MANRRADVTRQQTQHLRSERLNPRDQPDGGWRELPRFLGFHHGWLAELPGDAARAIRVENVLPCFHVVP